MTLLAVTDLVRFTHLLAVAIGLGAAFTADLQALTRLTTPIDAHLIRALQVNHRLVWAALIAMWITGTGMIFLRTGFDLAAFTPKLFSKLMTVGVLTANALLIGAVAMPMLRAAHGQAMLFLPFGRLLALSSLGAISTTSWLLALAMGVSKVLAASDWLTFEELLPAAYLAAVLGVALLMVLLRTLLGRPSRETA